MHITQTNHNSETSHPHLFGILVTEEGRKSAWLKTPHTGNYPPVLSLNGVDCKVNTIKFQMKITVSSFLCALRSLLAHNLAKVRMLENFKGHCYSSLKGATSILVGLEVVLVELYAYRKGG